MRVRNIRESDYAPIINVIDAWWGGRHMADMVPKLFFQHFNGTSFVVEEQDEVVAFLVGFVSQTDPEQAYIHFIGVHPNYRKRGFARGLYEHFFLAVQEHGCVKVHCVTSPVNKGSIAFHTNLGFQIEPGDVLEDGIGVVLDYDGRGHSRVRFVKNLPPRDHTEMDRTAVLVIDVQNGMFDEAEPVYNGTTLLHNTQLLLKKARDAGVPVIYMRHDGGEDSDLAYGTNGWHIHPAILPQGTDIVIEKRTPDSFHETKLNDVLRMNHVKRVVICGIQSEVCVDTTCRRAFSLGYEVVLASDAHSTWKRGHLDSDQIISYQNDVLRWFAEIVPTKDIVFCEE